MNATQVLSKRKWRQNLINRRYVGLFLIPRAVFENESVNDGTKRLINIDLSSGQKFRGAVTITSGREIYIPKHLHRYFENADWFDCEIVDNKLYEKSSLDIF